MVPRVLTGLVALSLGLSATSALAAGQRPPGGKSSASKSEASSPLTLDAAPGSEPADPLTPPEANNGPALAPGAAAVLAPTPATDVDPIVTDVRKRLADVRGPAGNADKSDRAALMAYYGQAGQPVWTTASGLSARATAVIAEIRRADDWGLDTQSFDLPALPAGQPTADALADAEIKLALAVLKYARYARGGRLDPQSLSHLFNHKPRLYDPKSVMQGIANAEAGDAYLRALHPKHAQFEKLRVAYNAARGKPSVVEAAPDTKLADGKVDVKIPAGPKIKPGAQHAQITLVRQRLGIIGEPSKDTTYDEALVKAVMAYQGEHGLEPTGLITNDTRTALNGAAKRSSSENTQRLLVNMERWRWMPENLGSFYVFDNVPEQVTRVIQDGKVVLTEKIVVGKVTTPTPLFTANMQFVVFNPEWGVPDGIKSNELAPLLRRSNNDGGWFFGGGGRSASSVLNGVGGLRASINGRPVDPDQVNWASIDIRQVQFTQPAGGRNVLGKVKFRFPNKHDVYMHDTPERHLFNSGLRAFSHGCMRVQNPERLAEVLLAHDKGWSADKVQGYFRQSGTADIKLSTEIPVHVAYFTASVDDDGKVQYRGDLYGLDNRVASALSGRQVQLVAEKAADKVQDAVVAEKSSDPSVRAERQIRPRPRVASRAQSASGGGFNPFSGLFGN